MDTSPSPFLYYSLFFVQNDWLLNSLCILFLPVFIGGCELGLKPSPEVVFETWKEAPSAESPPPDLALFLSLSPSLSQSTVVTWLCCYLHIISYFFIGSQSSQKEPFWNIQQA